jgi:protein-disulfide isomerase
MATMPRWRDVLDTISVICLVVASAVLVRSTFAPKAAAVPNAKRGASSDRAAQPAPLPSDPVPLGGAAMRGSERAKVVLIEFSDFQCPFCGKFARDTFPALDAQYIQSGKVQMAFRQFPMEMHRQAFHAAEGAVCAGQQGRFWEFHDALFRRPPGLDDPALQDAARVAGLRTKEYGECLGHTKDRVRDDVTLGQTLRISGTPTFLFGIRSSPGSVTVTGRMAGARPVADFQRVLDALIAQTAGRPPSSEPQP